MKRNKAAFYDPTQLVPYEKPSRNNNDLIFTTTLAVNHALEHSFAVVTKSYAAFLNKV